MSAEAAVLEGGSQKSEALLDIKDLTVHFPVFRGLLRRQVGAVKAVDGLTFDIRRGETLG